jgi:hypothetical protein
MTVRAAGNPFTQLEENLRYLLREAGFPDHPTEGGGRPFPSHITEELERQAHQSVHWYAAAILDELQALRHAIERGNPSVAGLAGFRAGDLYRISLKKFDWETPALRRLGILEGNGKPKKDWLNALAEKTYLARKKETGSEPSVMDVLLNLKKFDAPEESFARIVRNIDLKTHFIRWIDRRGKYRDTSFKSFKHRLTDIRRRYEE